MKTSEVTWGLETPFSSYSFQSKLFIITTKNIILNFILSLKSNQIKILVLIRIR